ncbi:MAG TPA: carboxypeptidase-like regulatory domain-containing protein [Gemmatimonadaceae bacterium]|nr:carboxypeptidase-like regulatory domain-containing protein [Gemmatimonadaceae bacterium]
MVVKYVVLAIVAGTSACKGSISGAVYAVDGGHSVGVGGQSVYLLSVSDEVRSVLNSACPQDGVAAWQEKLAAERERLRRVAKTYDDSAGDERALRGMSQRWRQFKRLSFSYTDSALRANAEPPTVSGDLIEKLSVKRASTSSNGEYEFESLPPGRYLIVADVRHEYRWVPVAVSRARATVDVRENSSHSGCAIASRM